MRRRTFLIAASGAAGLALAGRLRATPARAAPAADQKTLIMAPNFVIRGLDPGHTLEPDGEMGILAATLAPRQRGDASPDAKTKDQAEAWLQSHSAGSGPFMIQSYTPTQELVLARNPTHWRGPARLDRVVLRRVPEASTQALQL